MIDSFDIEQSVWLPGEVTQIRIGDLQIGDKFVQGNTLFEIAVDRRQVRDCADGCRVRWGSKQLWWFAYLHGRCFLLSPLKESTNPFSDVVLKGCNEIPNPLSEVDVLCFKEVPRGDPIPRPEHPFRHLSPEPMPVIPKGAVGDLIDHALLPGGNPMFRRRNQTL